MLKRFFQFILLLALFLLILGTSLWLNLRSEKITPWVENKINKRLPNPLHVNIDRMETRLFGLDIYQSNLIDRQQKQLLMQIQSVSISLNPVDLILFQKATYRVLLYQGEIHGSLRFFPELVTEFTLSGIEPNRNQYLRKTNLILSNPVVAGTGIYYIQNQPKATLELALDTIRLSGESSVTGLPFEFPVTSIQGVMGKVNLNNNKALVNLQTSGDITASLDGQITLDWRRMSRSKLDLNLKGTLTEKYESELGFFRDLLVNFKNASGQLALKVDGTLQRPRPSKLR